MKDGQQRIAVIAILRRLQGVVDDSTSGVFSLQGGDRRDEKVRPRSTDVAHVSSSLKAITLITTPVGRRSQRHAARRKNDLCVNIYAKVYG